jgi:hypothetical protein
MGTRDFPLRREATWGSGFDHHLSAGVKNALSCASTLTYIFVASCLIKHRSNCAYMTLWVDSLRNDTGAMHIREWVPALYRGKGKVVPVLN